MCSIFSSSFSFFFAPLPFLVPVGRGKIFSVWKLMLILFDGVRASSSSKIFSEVIIILFTRQKKIFLEVRMKQKQETREVELIGKMFLTRFCPTLPVTTSATRNHVVFLNFHSSHIPPSALTSSTCHYESYSLVSFFCLTHVGREKKI